MLRDILKVYIPIVAILVAVGLVAWHLMAPPPPNDLVIASGPEDGAYAAFAERYRAALAQSGLRLEVLHTSGSIENQQLLKDGKADIAFLQGGTLVTDPATGDPPDDIRALASIYYEPLWVFVRGIPRPERLAQLAGKRIAIGAEGSGTRALAISLLAANGIQDGRGKSELLTLPSSEAVERLLTGAIDAAFFVTVNPSPTMLKLLDAPDVRLMNFVQGEAYSHKFASLSALRLPRGMLDLVRDIPPYPMTMVASAAQLIARDDIDPALVDAILEVAQRIHRQSLFGPPGLFPSRDLVELPLNVEADRYFRSGPSLARRYLPFWAASLVERALILVLPLIGIAIPLIRFAPSIYNWQVSNRILKWYRHLRRIEDEVRSEVSPERRDKLVAELDGIQRQVGRTKVPSSYAQRLYELRLHIDLIRRLIAAESA